MKRASLILLIFLLERIVYYDCIWINAEWMYNNKKDHHNDKYSF